ncbi:MAG: hypothetical protein JWN17_883 [Frankiales bacterium]|nr:hypothetical protein [Frankiales bacterium]
MRVPLRLLAALALSLSCAAPALGTASAASPAAEKRVVRGTDGYLFIAQDWSVPCQYRGQSAATADRMAGFVAAVRRSGREARIVLGPDKATLRVGNLPKQVPLKACGQTEKDAVWSAVHQRLGSALVDLRKPLAGAGARWQTYYRQDTHWTPTSGTVYARSVAASFDPVVGRRLRTEPATYTRRGDLANVLGIPGEETVQGLQTVNPGVQVEERAREDQGIGMGSRHFTATPPPDDLGAVVPGKTLFIGDSFDGTVSTQVAPAFADSTFLWPDGETDATALAQRIGDFDRVVVMRVERFSSQWRPYDADVVKALAGLPKRRAL